MTLVPPHSYISYLTSQEVASDKKRQKLEKINLNAFIKPVPVAHRFARIGNAVAMVYRHFTVSADTMVSDSDKSPSFT